MALVLRNIYNFYRQHLIIDDDPRLDNFLVRTPWTIVSILTIYLYFVLNFGKRWMKNREPFELKTIMNIYNLVQVALNFAMVVAATMYGPKVKNFRYFCVPNPRYNDFTHPAKVLLYCHYIYLIVKIVDLLDTVFFILRKKFNQASFLHVYHHAFMVFVSYIHLVIIRGGGHGIGLGYVNCFVHTVMYFYYFLTSYKPELRQSIWWKKHITQLQLAQFTFLIFYFGIPIFTDCDYPKMLLIFALVQAVYMMVLFLDFYYKAYIKKKQ